MARGRASKFDGYWQLAGSPTKLLAHNQVSWALLQAAMGRRGYASYGDLVAAVKDHPYGSGSTVSPADFVVHCINQGWLARWAQRRSSA